MIVIKLTSMMKFDVEKFNGRNDFIKLTLMMKFDVEKFNGRNDFNL
jgi:hypothetical protein